MLKSDNFMGKNADNKSDDHGGFLISLGKVEK
jgi:hypothetical protein